MNILTTYVYIISKYTFQNLLTIFFLYINLLQTQIDPFHANNSANIPRNRQNPFFLLIKF